MVEKSLPNRLPNIDKAFGRWYGPVDPAHDLCRPGLVVTRIGWVRPSCMGDRAPTKGCFEGQAHQSSNLTANEPQL